MGAFLKRNHLNILSSDEVYNIHIATLEVLERTGVLVREKRALKLLDQAGAIVDYKKNLVKVPSYLVEEAVATTPKSFIWHARNPKKSIRIGGEPTKFGPGSECVNIIDLETGECRIPTKRDAEQLVRLMDALENIHINYPPASLSDVPEQVSLTHSFAITIKNSSKCTMGSNYGRSSALDSIRMASALVGGEEELRKKPTIAGYIDPVSPLIHDKELTEGLMEYASYGQPIFITTMALAGATGPATLAGVLVQQNAEILSGLLIVHLVNPHAPVIYGTVSCPMDMRTGVSSTGSPEIGLLGAASAQIARYYGIPCDVGAQSNAKVPDAQASYEKTMSLMMAVMAGADLIDLFAGSMESYRTTSYEQMVIDNELAGMALRCAEGIEVNAETIAKDVIDRVGPGGNYLADKHTLEWFRKEHHRPKLSDRRTRADWEKSGGKDIREEARNRAKEILASHEPEPVDPTIWREIEIIIKDIEKRKLGD
ncbi:MAG: trimethylamine methyltransferase family protein [Candidatus Bathyarchaeota archaeon]|nr:trimethylamine methyltransferase family protein [Candidatus Bathyarchaeota archaeon]MDH5713390.1 trimethylamine methyltransferase family protein [Candidatus Bathyarchaeota archaeon]